MIEVKMKLGALVMREGDTLYSPANISLLHHVNAALRAHVLFEKNVDYIVNDEGEVVIVDEHTGRTMPGRRWSDGLHQAVEAKEGVKIQNENQTLASITFQNYFRPLPAPPRPVPSLPLLAPFCLLSIPSHPVQHPSVPPRLSPFRFLPFTPRTLLICSAPPRTFPFISVLPRHAPYYPVSLRLAPLRSLPAEPHILLVFSAPPRPVPFLPRPVPFLAPGRAWRAWPGH